MSTSGLIGFVVDGELKATYNHSDSYPDWLGVQALRFARQLVKDGAVAEAAQRVRELRVVTAETPITGADLDALSAWTNTRVGGSATQPFEWYQLLRKTQGDPDAILTAGYIEDGADFARDSLFCEWGYVLDFDEQVLEVYRGFRNVPPTAGRWAGFAPDGEQVKRQRSSLGSVYYPIEQIAVFGFGSLPSDETFVMHTESLVAGSADTE